MGVAGGLLSSTNVTWTFGRLESHRTGVVALLGFGAVAANAVLYPRVLAATAVLNTPLVPVLGRYLVAPAAVATLVAMAGVLAARRDVAVRSHVGETTNPLALGSALQMAALFQAVLMLVHLARVTQGAGGVFASAAVLGLTDVDALTLSMARDVARTISLETAATAIAIGVLANTLLKAVIRHGVRLVAVPRRRCGSARRDGARVRSVARMASLIRWPTPATARWHPARVPGASCTTRTHTCARARSPTGVSHDRIAIAEDGAIGADLREARPEWPAPARATNSPFSYA